MYRVHLNVVASILVSLVLALTRTGHVAGRRVTDQGAQVVSHETTLRSAASSSPDVVQLNETRSSTSPDPVSTSSTAPAPSTSSTSSPSSSSVSLRSTASTVAPSSGHPGGLPSSAGTTSSSTTPPEPDFLNSLDASILYQNFTVEKQLRIEAIKQDILNRLGMTRVPDVSRINMTVQERRQILRLYKKSVEELHGKKESSRLFDDDQFYANQFHSFTEYGYKPVSVADRLWRVARKKRIFFSVDIPEPADPRKETLVKSATLKLYKRNVRPQNLQMTDIIDRSLRIEIFQVLQLTADQYLRRSIDSRLVSLDKASWEEFDVSRAVQDWIRDPSTNLGLEIACDNRYRMEDVLDFVVWSPPVADNPYQSSLLPALNVLTHERRILGRQKRTLPERSDCTQGDGEERCCRYPLTIHFRDINWHNWVIEPESYQAYYCDGSCPRDYRVAHRYARIKLLMRERNPTMQLNVDCIQTRMGSLNIAHYNSEGILVVSVFDNMYPEECMCA